MAVKVLNDIRKPNTVVCFQDKNNNIFGTRIHSNVQNKFKNGNCKPIPDF